MKIISDVVVYIIMFFAVWGCLASIFKPESEMGNQFLEGINAIGSIFLPVAGIMASLPILISLITNFIAPVFAFFGADPKNRKATTFLPCRYGWVSTCGIISRNERIMDYGNNGRVYGRCYHRL
ncbi:ethanolamine utilization protein EutH [Erysipelothrix sp. D19-032]